MNACGCGDLAPLKREFAYFTECQLAILEEMRSRKTVAKSRLERQRQIAAKMVAACDDFGVEPKDRRNHNCPRLARALKEGC
jgi:hypothetical protein